MSQTERLVDFRLLIYIATAFSEMDPAEAII